MEEKDPLDEKITLTTRDFIQILEDTYTLGFKQSHLHMEKFAKFMLDMRPNLELLGKFMQKMSDEEKEKEK
tara:strand:+ start:212 stop:424 length:213 start_codon:yes stop_codon:yes gene_type:complete